jgi:hypothetical protein
MNMYIRTSIPVCERSKEKLGMYDRYPPGNNYQVVFNSQFGVIKYCQLNLLSENQFIHGIEVSYIPVHSHDIQVILRPLLPFGLGR